MRPSQFGRTLFVFLCLGLFLLVECRVEDQKNVRRLHSTIGTSSLSMPESSIVVPMTPFILEFQMEDGETTNEELIEIEALVDSYLNTYVMDIMNQTGPHDFELQIVKTHLITHTHGETSGTLFTEFQSFAGVNDTATNIPTVQLLDEHLKQAFYETETKQNFLKLLNYFPDEHAFRGVSNVEFSLAPPDMRTSAMVSTSSTLIPLSHYNLIYTLPETKIPSAFDLLPLEKVTNMYLKSCVMEEASLPSSWIDQFSTVVVQHWSTPGKIEIRYESTLHLKSDNEISAPTVEQLDAIRLDAFGVSHLGEYIELLEELPSTNTFSFTQSVQNENDWVSESLLESDSWLTLRVVRITVFAIGSNMLFIGIFCLLRQKCGKKFRKEHGDKCEERSVATINLSERSSEGGLSPKSERKPMVDDHNYADSNTPARPKRRSLGFSRKRTTTSQPLQEVPQPSVDTESPDVFDDEESQVSALTSISQVLQKHNQRAQKHGSPKFEMSPNKGVMQAIAEDFDDQDATQNEDHYSAAASLPLSPVNSEFEPYYSLTWQQMSHSAQDGTDDGEGESLGGDGSTLSSLTGITELLQRTAPIQRVKGKRHFARQRQRKFSYYRVHAAPRIQASEESMSPSTVYHDFYDLRAIEDEGAAC